MEEKEHGPQGEDVEPGLAGLKLWAQRNDDPGKRPAAKLEAMVPGASPGTLRNAVPQVMSRERYTAAIKGAGIPARAAKTKPERVPISQLGAFQSSVNAERLASYVDDPTQIPKGKRAVHSGQPVDVPVVVRLDGKLLVHDGNHRVSAAILRGDRDIMVRVVDLDAGK